MSVVFALALSTSVRAATITVDSLADTGAPGICVLRDAITAANTKTAINGCPAGSGNDTIQFSVTGTISLGSTLPQITDSRLTINGPVSPGITIDGSGQVQVMQVASGATLNLSKLTIAHGLTVGSGGAIANSGTLTVTSSTLSDNISNAFEYAGGGIYNTGRLTIINSSFSGNDALGPGGAGGGIENFIGTLSIIGSTFSSNEAAFGGGIDNEGTLTVTNSTFSGNFSGDGGGIFNGGKLAVINNSTFYGNIAQDVGAIDNFTRLTITNSTFAGNSAVFVGGIINELLNSKFNIKSSILAANRGGNCYENGGPTTDVGYNIADDTTCHLSATTSRENTNPRLDPNGLRNNGGPTQTVALIMGSPAIDAIQVTDCTDQASPPNPIITDQRLFPRPDSEEDLCDIGAYEFQDTAFIPFAGFHGGLEIDPQAGFFSLSGGFKLGLGGSIDPTTQPLAFGIGSYAIRLPAGSFFKVSNGFVYQKKVNGVFLCLYIKLTDTPGGYVLLAIERGATPASTSLVPVTLTIGDNSGSTQMNARFD